MRVTFRPGEEGGQGTPIYGLTILVCAAVQGMVFKPFYQGQGIENTRF